MRPVLRRIAIHGGLTALVLGLFGLMFAELGAIWLSSAPAARSAEAAEAADAEVAARLRGRVPLLMAAWGFGFVAVAEVVVHYFRKRRAAAMPAVAQPQPDDAEKLLLELLAKAEAEAAARQESGVGSQESGNREGHSPPATPPVS
jgi:hypothetical protein